jgi:hypothetical protein
MTLEIITAEALAPVRHGFFTRRGGASSGIFSGLNCGPGSSDQSEIVTINRARVAGAMQVAPDRLVTVRQVHSADVVNVTAPPETRPRADAIVTATPGLALAILTADCQPVLFADVEAGVIGVAHAGWRGALDGVLEAALDAMEALGAARARSAAVIGPTISAITRSAPNCSMRSWPTTPRARASSPMARATAICSTCRATGFGGCAAPGSCGRNGPGIAPMPTRTDSIPTAAPPMKARPITDG